MDDAHSQRLALLLAMAMFVLVVDTSLMNVSISAVVARPRHDGQRRAVGDRARGARLGRVHPDRQQGRRPHRPQARLRARPARLRDRRAGDDARPEPDRDHHLLGDHRRARRVAAAARDAVADPRQLRGRGADEGLRAGRRRRRDRRRGRAAARRLHHHLPVVARRVPARGRRHRDRALRASGSSTTCRTPGRAGRRRSARCSRSSAWAAIVLGILVWQEGGESVGALLAVGAVALVGAGRAGSCGASAQGKPTLLDPDLFKSKLFRLGISQQMLQQIALGGTMIALPIYLQMVLEYNAMQAGLSLAPLSLSMFAMALLAGRKAGEAAPEQHHPARASRSCRSASSLLLPIVPRADSGWALVVPLIVAGVRARPARLAAQQLHAVADLRGAGQRGRRRQLGRRARSGCRSGWRSPARSCWPRSRSPSRTWPRQQGAPAGRAAAGRRRARGRRRGDEQHPARRSCSRASPQDVQAEIIRINTDARPHRAPGRAAHPDPRRPARARSTRSA